MSAQCCERVGHTHTTRRVKENVCVVLWVVWSLYTQMLIGWCLNFMDMVWADPVWLLCTILHIFDDTSYSMEFHVKNILCRARTNIRNTVSTGLFISKGEYYNLPLHHYNELIKLCSVSQSEEFSQDKLISKWALPPAIHNHLIRIFWNIKIWM